MSKKIFFASDFHLGTDGRLSSLDREKNIVRWLDSISDDMEALYLVGDIFDYWFEYGQVIPKGFSRLFGKLAELRDAGIPIYFFIGNHDMWMFRYFEDEFGIPIYRSPIERSIQGAKCLIGHGDGLGPGDQGYKVIKSIFSNKFCQWAFARIHPNLGLRIMKKVSKKSRDMAPEIEGFDPEKEWLIQYAEGRIHDGFDYFIFGHRHLPLYYKLSNQKSKYINLGDWLHFQSYGVMEDGVLSVKFFENESGFTTYPI